MTTAAVTHPVHIVCPPWCNVAPDRHLEDLAGCEGSVIHWSGDHDVLTYESDSINVRLSRLALPDGTRDEREGAADLIFVDDTSLTVTQATLLAEAITAAVKEARR